MTYNIENLKISPYYPYEIVEAWGGQEEFNRIPSVKWASIHHPTMASKIWDGRAIEPLKGKDIPFILFSTHSNHPIIENTVLIYSLDESLSLDQWKWKANWQEGVINENCVYILRLFRGNLSGTKPMNRDELTHTHMDGHPCTNIWRA